MTDLNKPGKTDCPYCGKVVHTKQIDGRLYGYYEEKEPTEVERKVEARLGIPFRHFVTHKCEGITELKELAIIE